LWLLVLVLWVLVVLSFRVLLLVAWCDWCGGWWFGTCVQTLATLLVRLLDVMFTFARKVALDGVLKERARLFVGRLGGKHTDVGLNQVDVGLHAQLFEHVEASFGYASAGVFEQGEKLGDVVSFVTEPCELAEISKGLNGAGHSFEVLRAVRI